MQYRSPTRHDIGKMVEVANNRDFSDAQIGMLEQWTTDYLGNYFWIKDELRRHGSFEFCRVPYTSPDPITELSIAADWLAERGMDEAARVCMAEVEKRKDNQRVQASVERLIAEGLGVLPDEPRPNWEEHDYRHWIYRNPKREPVVALRFETEEINAGRYDLDRKNYTVGMWNSHVRPVWHSEHMIWPDGTPLNEMQEQIEQADIRIRNTPTTT